MVARGNQVLKLQQVKGAELIIKIQIRRKLILSIASAATTLQMRGNAYDNWRYQQRPVESNQLTSCNSELEEEAEKAWDNIILRNG